MTQRTTDTDEQAEWWALGALMEYDAATLLSAHPLVPEAFSTPERALAFRAIASLVDEGRPVTLEGVVLRLRGTAAQHLTLAANASIDAHGWGVERFGPVAERLRGLLRKRRYLGALEESLSQGRAVSADVGGVAAALQDRLRDLDAGLVEVDRTGADDLLEVVDDWQHADERPQRITTGVPLLDEHLGGGWMPNINILAGEPGALKSGLAATCAAAELEAGLSVGYVGVEEGTKFIQRRLIAARMGMRLAAVSNTRLHEHQMERLGAIMGELHPLMSRLHVNADATNPERLVRTVRRWVQKGCRVVYIDHLGELEHRQNVRDRHDLAIRNTLLALRPLALRHNVALVLIAHLNRESEGGRPKKHHLKESGYIEAMGRLVLGCWRHPKWPERQLIEVMKGNEVETDVTLWLPRLSQAALVESAGGGTIDWEEVERERREQQRGAVGGWRRGAAGE